MTNPTSNYSFQMPTSTDLVTDLPADFEVFGQAVDTRIKALNPETTLGDLAYGSATANTNTRLPIGTTGQVLAVVGGVPAWQNGTTGDIEGVTAGVGISGGGTSGTVTVTNSMATAITTNGDLIYGTGSGTFTRRGIGTTGQVLTVSGGVPTWSTPAGGGKVLQVVMGSDNAQQTTSSTSFVDTNMTATITPSSTSSKVLILANVGNLELLAASQGGDFGLARNGTDFVTFSEVGYSDSAATIGSPSTAYLDSPASTSALTYKIRVKARGSYNITIGNGNPTNTIVLMEIGA